MSPVPSAGKRVRVSRGLVLVLLLIGQGSGARFFNQSQTVAMRNQSNCGNTFDTQLKSAINACNWFLFYFWLVEKVARDVLAN